MSASEYDCNIFFPNDQVIINYNKKMGEGARTKIYDGLLNNNTFDNK